jgi:heme/copper-type cytochrome/quinol oxidase subunit 3
MTATTRPMPVATSLVQTPGWWGMICLVATEAALFAYLLFSYFYIGAQAAQWPPTSPPELRLALPNTIILLVSSGTLLWAESGMKKGQRSRYVLGAAITIVLGIIFLCIQVAEYHGKNFGPTSHAYGSLFFTITGFHFAHVTVGLLMLAEVEIRAMLGHFSAERHLAVRNTSLYWHFVDVVWLCVFFSLYLTPHIWWHR